MRRGSTPTHTFNIPFDISMIANVRITYAQDKTVILRKEMKDCTLENNSISLRLSQADTLKFDDRRRVRIQLKVLTLGGECLPSDIFYVSADECLDDGVIE